jgi:hypothetical protein
MGNVTKLPRLIQGEILKCVDGRWTTRDGQALPLGTQLFVRGMTRALQCWKDGELLDSMIETPETPLPDLGELNKQIPMTEWEEGLDGKPRPPWALYYVVYLMSPEDGADYTSVNNTSGQRIAWEQLQSRICNVRMLRGANVVALVELDSKPMTTKFGTKQRPSFKITDWRVFEGGEQAALPPPTNNSGSADAAEKPAEAKPEPAPAKKNAPKKKAVPGKPVKPVSLKEELNDDLPPWGAG